MADSRHGEVQKLWGSAFLCALLEQEECECGEICQAKRSLPRCPQINCELLQNEEFSLKYQAVGAVLVQEAAVLGLSYTSPYLVRSAVQYASPHLHHYTKRKKSTTLMASFHKPNSGSDPASVLAASVAFLNRVYFIPTQPVDPKIVILAD